MQQKVDDAQAAARRSAVHVIANLQNYLQQTLQTSLARGRGLQVDPRGGKMRIEQGLGWASWGNSLMMECLLALTSAHAPQSSSTLGLLSATSSANSCSNNNKSIRSASFGTSARHELKRQI